MTINYGKREAGGLTAASPGDTLYIPYATYNDSGASINDTGLVPADIKVFKNGGVTARATDSGIHIGDTGTAGDTGQYGDNIGLSRISLRIYNTADDTGFYDAGSQYHVAITGGLSIDAREVNFFPAVFEIGRQAVDVKEIVGDTGAARHLAQLSDEYDTGRLPAEATATLDTGAIKDAVWQTAAGTSGPGGIGTILDTGLASANWAQASRTLTAFAFDTGVSDTVWKETARTVTSFAFDTGVSDTVWKETSRQLTAFAFDTGVANTVWKESSSTFTGDTGSVGYAQGRLMAVHADTGAAHIDQGRLGVVSDSGKMAAVLDTGKVAAAVWSNHATRILSSFAFDTGIWASNAARTLTAFSHDTGIADTVWKSSQSAYTDTGSLGFGVNLHYVRGDTGAAANVFHAFVDTGKIATTATSTIDTGATKDAVWQTPAGTDGRGLTESLNIDTGISDTVWKQAARTLTGFAFDTGVSDTVWKAQKSGYDTDTGAVAFYLGNITEIRGDTGTAEHLVHAFGDTGKATVSATATLDTGQMNQAVWQADASRVLTAGTNLDFGAHDTGVRKLLADYDTGIRSVLAAQDTGKVLNALVVVMDTGKIADAVDTKRILTLDTGKIADAVDIKRTLIADTGKMTNAVRTAMVAIADTGKIGNAVWAIGTRTLTANTNLNDPTIASIVDGVWDEADTGHQVVGTMGFRQNDTGEISNAVWAKGTRVLTANTNLSGLAVDVTQVDGDTGQADRLGKFAAKLSTAGQIDTGILAGTQAGTVDSNITYVNETAVGGAGDTGLANTWGPA